MRGIPYILTFVVITAFLCLPASSSAQLNAQLPSPLRLQGGKLLVLKNGEILQGKIKQSPEKFVIETVQGSRLVMQSGQVDFVCNSLVEAYWEKCSRTKASDISGQARLFQWCVKHKLYKQAQNQISLLTQTKIKADQLAALDRQLNASIRMSEASRLRNQGDMIASSQEQAGRTRNTFAAGSQEPTNNDLVITVPAQESLTDMLVQSKKLTPVNVENTIGIPKLDLSQIDTSVFEALPLITSMPDRHRFASLAPIESSTDINEDLVFKPIPPRINNFTIDGSVRQVGFEEVVEPAINGLNTKLTIDAEGRPLQPMASSSRQSENAKAFQGNENTEVGSQKTMQPLTRNEIDAGINELPKPFVGFYRKRVAKLFTNGCKAANCHEMTDAVMPLMHRSKALPLSDVMSRRNLYHIAEYLDSDNPLSSPAFLAATQPHAGQTMPIYKLKSKQRAQLVRWLAMLGPGTTQPTSQYELPATQAANNSEEPSAEQSLADLQPVKPARAELLPIGAAPLSSTIGEIPDLGTREKKYIPVDPFDPEIFNRKHHKK